MTEDNLNRRRTQYALSRRTPFFLFNFPLFGACGRNSLDYHWSMWQAFGSLGGQTGTGMVAKDTEVEPGNWALR